MTLVKHLQNSKYHKKPPPLAVVFCLGLRYMYMDYIYHLVPKEMRGDHLHPVSRLKLHFPELYRHKRAKREDKRYRHSEVIPYVNAKWSETLHFFMVDPKKIKDVLAKHGVQKSLRVWKIPVQLLRQNRSIIFHGKRGDDWYHMANFSSFDKKAVQDYRKLSPAIIDYYKRHAATDDIDILHPLPQVLFKGSVNIANCEIMEL